MAHQTVLAGKLIAWTLLIIGALIEFLSIKYPYLARILFHLETLQSVLLMIIPVDAESHADPSYFSAIFLNPLLDAICFACDLKLAIGTLILSLGFGNVYLYSH